jgi:hypothetical protein
MKGTVSEKRKRGPSERDYRGVVGQIATTWSLFEKEIEFMVWWLADLHPDPGISITSQLQSVRAKLMAMEGLAHLRTGSDVMPKAIRKFMSEIEGAVRTRNRIIHDPMIIEKIDGRKEAFLIRTHLDRTVHRRLDHITLDALHKFNRDIFVLMNTFSILKRDIVAAASSAFPDRQFSQPPPIPPHRNLGARTPSAPQRRPRSSRE